jgi:hypothetical protein
MGSEYCWTHSIIQDASLGDWGHGLSGKAPTYKARPSSNPSTNKKNKSKTTKNAALGGGRGLRKNNGGGELDQSIHVWKSHNETPLYN